MNGAITAASEALARARLNELGFSVLSLQEAAAQTASSGPKFHFEALDNAKRHVEGSIEAENELAAFIRLKEEYQLDVAALYVPEATEQIKEVARQAGMASLKAKYEQLKGPSHSKHQEAHEEKIDAERHELMAKVDFTTTKIKALLTQFGDEIKASERTIIQGYIDQLERIKSSTNLAHIRHTCEKMLTHIQQQELFVQELAKVKEKAEVEVQTKTLLSSLQNRGLRREINLRESIDQFIAQSKLGRALGAFMPQISPEEQNLRRELQNVDKQMGTYIKMWIHPKSAPYREQAKESVKGLWQERKRLKRQIKKMRARAEVAEVNTGEGLGPSFFMYQTSGAALAIMLAYYFFGIIISSFFPSLQIPIQIPLLITDSHILKYVLGFLIILHGASGAMHLFMRHSIISGFLTYPIAATAFLFFVVNF